MAECCFWQDFTSSLPLAARRSEEVYLMSVGPTSSLSWSSFHLNGRSLQGGWGEFTIEKHHSDVFTFPFISFNFTSHFHFASCLTNFPGTVPHKNTNGWWINIPSSHRAWLSFYRLLTCIYSLVVVQLQLAMVTFTIIQMSLTEETGRNSAHCNKLLILKKTQNW